MFEPPKDRVQAFLTFQCGCGYKEELGIGVNMGISISGVMTIVCPRCGNIVTNPGALLMNPLRPIKV